MFTLLAVVDTQLSHTPFLSHFIIFLSFTYGFVLVCFLALPCIIGHFASWIFHPLLQFLTRFISRASPAVAPQPDVDVDESVSFASCDFSSDFLYINDQFSVHECGSLLQFYNSCHFLTPRQIFCWWTWISNALFDHISEFSTSHSVFLLMTDWIFGLFWTPLASHITRWVYLAMSMLVYLLAWQMCSLSSLQLSSSWGEFFRLAFFLDK